MELTSDLLIALLSLCQGLIWPVFVGIILLAARTQVVAILKSVSRRIDQGDPIQAGPISIGKNENKLTRLEDRNNQIESSSANDEYVDGETPDVYQEITYLIHSVSAPRIDSDGVERRGIQVVVDADGEEILDEIDKVVYHLHPSFRDPDRVTADRKRRFQLNTRAWGEFNLSADVYFNGYKKPLTVYRYINFQNY